MLVGMRAIMIWDIQFFFTDYATPEQIDISLAFPYRVSFSPVDNRCMINGTRL